jgi:proline iminopeptidase
MDAANHWYDWEEDIIRLLPREVARMGEDELLAFARIECHFIVNNLFLPEDDYLVNNAGKIAHLACWIAQGRYDIICPVVSAVRLSQNLPNAELHIVPDAGHSISEPGIVDSLIRGIESLADRY